MEQLKHDEISKTYTGIIRKMQEKHENLKGVLVEVSEVGEEIKLTIDSNDLYLTPEQAVDLMKELRRAVVKVKPKALRDKGKR